MSHKSNNISILQFDERLISRLRVRRSNKGVDIIAFDQERGEWPARDGSLAEALKSFAARHGLAEDGVYTILPRHDMTARILEMPSQDRAELANMLSLSAEEYVPFPADELVIDHSVIELLPDGRSRVLVVFAHRDVVETHLKLLQEARIDPDQVFLSTACLASAAIAAAGGQDERRALVNLASGGLEVVVTKGKRLEYGRAVASTQDWDLNREGTSRTEVIEELAVEVRASLTAYRRESEEGEGVDAVYLCSDYAPVDAPCAELFHALGQECAPASFAGDLIVHGADLVAGLPVASLGAALLAQDRGVLAVSLLPKSFSRAREREDIKKDALRFGAFAAAIFLALGLVYAQAAHHRKAYIRDLEARIAQIQPRAMGIASKQKQLRILQEQVERSASVIELLAALCDLFPASGMNITRFAFGHNDRIDVYGRARTLQQIEKLTQDLVELGKTSLPQFAQAKQFYEQKAMERDQEVLDFRITIPFAKSEAAKSEGDESE